MREQLRIGSRLSCIVAWALAVAGRIVHLQWSGTWTWWLGVALLVPLLALAAWRADRRGDPDGVGVVGDSLPLGPP